MVVRVGVLCYGGAGILGGVMEVWRRGFLGVGGGMGWGDVSARLIRLVRPNLLQVPVRRAYRRL